MVMKFASPFVLFILLYYLSLILGGKRSTALIAASFVILGSNLAARPNEILSIFGLGSGYHPGFNNYFRPINPEISSMVFFGYLVLFYKFIKNPKFLTGLFLGIILGVSFYFYLFTWTFLLVLTGMLLIFAVITKKYGMAKCISLTLAISLFLSVPYWFEALRAISSPAYFEAALRFGMVSGRHFFISGSLALVAMITVFLFLRYLFGRERCADREVSIFWSDFRPFHSYRLQSTGYHRSIHTIAPLSFYVHYFDAYNFCCFCVLNYVQKINFFRKDFSKVTLVVVALIFLLINNFKWQMASYFHVRQTAYQRQEYIPAIEWIKRNAAENSIIFGDVALSSLIPVFTSLDIYPSGFAQYYLLPSSIFKRYSFTGIRFAGVKPEEAENKFLGELRNKLSYEIHGIRYRKNMPNEEAVKLAQEYAVFYRQNFKQALDEDYYRPDYLVFDQKFNELALPESETGRFMKQVASIDGRFLVYKMK